MLWCGGIEAEYKTGLEHSLQIVKNTLNRWELKVNYRKTKLYNSLELLALSLATASRFSAHTIVHTHTVSG